MNLSVRRPSRRRLGVAVVVLLLAGMLASLVGASAAQLNLGPVARQHAEVKERCDLDGVALTTPSTSTTTTRVDVGGIAAACVGLPIVVRVSTGAGASSSTTATNVIAGGSMSITTASPAFSPAAVVQTSVTIGDWPMSGTWSYTPPAAPTNTCGVFTMSGGTAVPVPGRTCTVSLPITASFWSLTQGNMSVNFDAPGIQPTEFVQFTVVVPASALPSGWTWAGKYTQFNNLGSSGQVLSRCADLPAITARFAPNLGPTLNAYTEFNAGSGDASPLRCKP